MNIKMFKGNNLPHELLLTTRQKTKVRNAFENNMSTDTKLSEAQISKIIQSGGFLGSLLSKIAGPLMKVAIALAKSISAPSGITAAASAIDGSGSTTLIISNEVMLFKLLKILMFYWKELQKQSKMNKRTKRRIFNHVIRYFRS